MPSRVCKVVVLAAVLALGALTGATAQQSPQKIYKLLGLSVEGNVTSDAGTIIATSGLRVGDEIVVPGDMTAKAIVNLWSLRLFRDVQLVVDRELNEGVFLKIRVVEYPRLERMVITGNDEFSEDELRTKIGLVKGQIVRPQDFDVLRRKLVRSYEEKGYMLATVNFREEPDTTAVNRTILNVEIDEGPEVAVAGISFTGNSRFSESELRGAMDETTQKTWWKFWSSNRFDRKNYEKDKQLIVDLYRENGYLDAEVVSDSIWYGADREDMYIRMTINEGRPSYIRRIIFRGNTIYTDSLLLARLDFREGDLFNAVKFEQNLKGNQEQTDVASVYLDNGYLRFFAQDERVRVAADSIDVIITITESNKFRIGHVQIAGNTKTQDKVIRRVLYTCPGITSAGLRSSAASASSRR
jgi:outer membrane protein insertion porin family